MKLDELITKKKNKNNQLTLFYPETNGNNSMKVNEAGNFLVGVKASNLAEITGFKAFHQLLDWIISSLFTIKST